MIDLFGILRATFFHSEIRRVFDFNTGLHHKVSVEIRQRPINGDRSLAGLAKTFRRRFRQRGIPVAREPAFRRKVSGTTNPVDLRNLASPVHFKIPDNQNRRLVCKVDHHHCIPHAKLNPMKQ